MMKNKINKEKLTLLAIFSAILLITLQISINKLAGSRVSFTLFDLVAPTAGALLGVWYGIASVLVAQVINLVLHGTSNIDRGAIIRLIPTLFGVWFFAKREGKLLVLPAIAILSFNLNEVGRSVWYYSLFWLIPYFVYPFYKKSLFARSIGATFTTHAVGGAIWIWAIKMPASVWQGLIPVVAMERMIFALGISASFILITNIFGYLGAKSSLFKAISSDKKYLFGFFK